MKGIHIGIGCLKAVNSVLNSYKYLAEVWKTTDNQTLSLKSQAKSN